MINTQELNILTSLVKEKYISHIIIDFKNQIENEEKKLFNNILEKKYFIEIYINEKIYKRNFLQKIKRKKSFNKFLCMSLMIFQIGFFTFIIYSNAPMLLAFIPFNTLILTVIKLNLLNNEISEINSRIKSTYII